MIYDGFNSLAFHRPSASTLRPSASVFSTSIVFPEYVSITSPGLYASALGIFSAIHVIPLTRPSYPVACNDWKSPKTVAEPCISNFISSMPALPLMDIPPESKVIPFPTIQGTCSSTSEFGFRQKKTIQGLCTLPFPTSMSPFIPSSFRRLKSQTSTSTFSFPLAHSNALLPNSSG